jgi:hypothetical protein
MKKNKTGKYFKYAIGEIVLVVFGILIALQINIANEKRKDRIQEITILENIQEDILLDTLDISFNIDYHKEFIDAEKRLLFFLQNNLQQPRDSINYSSALGVPLTIALHKSTFNNLQNNQIGIITNNKLKKDISRFYDFFVQAISKIENEKPIYESYSSKKVFFQKYFTLSKTSYEMNNTQSNNEDYYNPNLVKVNMEFKDITGAKNDDAFKIELNESIFIRQVKIDFYIDMVNRIKELNVAINEELKVLRN